MSSRRKGAPKHRSQRGARDGPENEEGEILTATASVAGRSVEEDALSGASAVRPGRLRWAHVEAREFIRFPGGGIPEDDPVPTWALGMADAVPIRNAAGEISGMTTLPLIRRRPDNAVPPPKSILKRTAAAASTSGAESSRASPPMSAEPSPVMFSPVHHVMLNASTLAAVTASHTGCPPSPRGSAMSDVPHHHSHTATSAVAVVVAAVSQVTPLPLPQGDEAAGDVAFSLPSEGGVNHTTLVSLPMEASAPLPLPPTTAAASSASVGGSVYPSTFVTRLEGTFYMGTVAEHEMARLADEERRRLEIVESANKKRRFTPAEMAIISAAASGINLPVFRPFSAAERSALLIRDLVDCDLQSREGLTALNAEIAEEYKAILDSRRATKIGCTCALLSTGDVTKLSVKKLKATLVAHGLPTHGAKPDLQVRLLEYSRHHAGCMRKRASTSSSSASSSESHVLHATDSGNGGGVTGGSSGADVAAAIGGSSGVSPSAASTPALSVSSSISSPAGAFESPASSCCSSSTTTSVSLHSVDSLASASSQQPPAGGRRSGLDAFADPHEECMKSRHNAVDEPLVSSHHSALLLAAWVEEQEAQAAAAAASSTSSAAATVVGAPSTEPDSGAMSLSAPGAVHGDIAVLSVSSSGVIGSGEEAAPTPAPTAVVDAPIITVVAADAGEAAVDFAVAAAAAASQTPAAAMENTEPSPAADAPPHAPAAAAAATAPRTSGRTATTKGTGTAMRKRGSEPPLVLNTPCPCAESGISCHWGSCYCCQDCCSNRPDGDPTGSKVDLEADVYRAVLLMLLAGRKGDDMFLPPAIVASGWDTMRRTTMADSAEAAATVLENIDPALGEPFYAFLRSSLLGATGGALESPGGSSVSSNDSTSSTSASFAAAILEIAEANEAADAAAAALSAPASSSDPAAAAVPSQGSVRRGKRARSGAKAWEPTVDAEGDGGSGANPKKKKKMKTSRRGQKLVVVATTAASASSSSADDAALSHAGSAEQQQQLELRENGFSAEESEEGEDIGPPLPALSSSSSALLGVGTGSGVDNDEEEEEGSGTEGSSMATDELIMDLDDEKICDLDNGLVAAGYEIAVLNRAHLRGIVEGQWTVAELVSSIQANEGTAFQNRAAIDGGNEANRAVNGHAAPAVTHRNGGGRKRSRQESDDAAAAAVTSPSHDSSDSSSVEVDSAQSPPPSKQQRRQQQQLVADDEGYDDDSIGESSLGDGDTASVAAAAGPGGRSLDTPGPGSCLPSDLPPFAAEVAATARSDHDRTE